MLKEICEIFCLLKEFLTLNLPSIVSTASVIIAFFAWRETTRSRKSTFHPDIIIPSNDIFFEVNRSNSDEDNKWTTRFFGMKSKEKDYQNVINIYPMNIGLGVAKEIEIDWKYDLKKIVNSINKYKHPKYIVDYLKYDKDIEIISLVNKQNHSESFDSVHEVKIEKDKLPYIIPNHQVQNKEQYFFLPESLLNTYFYYILLKHNEFEDSRDNFHSDSFNELNMPILEIKYRDVQNNSLKKKFVVKIEANDTLLNGQKENEVSFYLSLEYNEIKN